MRRRPLTALAVAGAALGVTLPSAQAAYFPADTVDGPNADITGLANIDLSRDGTGTVGYTKREGGTVHVFASRLDLGRPQPPVRVDVGQLTDSTEARLAVANDHRAVAVWVNGGDLWFSQRPDASKPWSAPARIYDHPVLPVQNPQLDVTIFGTAFVSFSVGTDVLVGRMPYDGGWTVLPAPVDVDATRIATDADISAAADGSAIVAWTETGLDNVSHVFTRRITIKGQLSGVPREVGVASFNGRPGGNADSPSVSIQDDSSYAFVSWRQDFVDAGTTVSRGLARRLVASEFEEPKVIDGLRFPAGAGAAAESEIFVASRGEGSAISALRTGEVVGTGISRQGLGYTARWFRSTRLDNGGNTAPAPITTAMADALTGVAAWQESPGGGVLARIWSTRRWEQTTRISDAPGGAELGLDSGADARTDFVLGYVSGAAGARSVQVTAYAGPLRPAGLPSTSEWFNNARLKLDWTALTNVVWGPVTYRIEVDGKLIGTTRKSSFVPPKPLKNGVRKIEIIQVDGRGQVSPGLERFRNIDTRKPRLSVRRSGGGYRISASDGRPGRTSGVDYVQVGSRKVFASNGVVRARVGGRASRIIAVDEAGNRTVRRG
jgi:hypothetical protein